MNPRLEIISMRSASGFSLFELVMVIVLLGIFAAMASPLMSSGFRAYFVGKDIAETDGQARAALERLSRELRSVRAPADLTISSASDISFVDVDGIVARYCMGAVGGCPGIAGDLMRNSQPLATGISGLTFSFLTNTGAATAVAAQVFYITASFTATQNTISKSFQVTISPRNFP